MLKDMRAFLIICSVVQCLGQWKRQEFSADYEDDGYSSWSSWTSCSASCGEGIRQRHRRCISEVSDCLGATVARKHCFDQFCPSYLSWPRIHFSGMMIADANTANNIRCAYENENFSAAELSKHYIGLQKMKGTHIYYSKATGNWNPDGTNQIYFHNTYVTSFCLRPEACTTTDPNVGLEVVEMARGVMAVLDVDWQYATEIWGLSVKIPGILEGVFQTSSHQVQVPRLLNEPDKTRGYSMPLMSRYKSKLLNVTWHDQFYKTLFSDAKELSISFVYDLFNQYSLEGRISGTIGKTSSDEPSEMGATRTLHSPHAGERGEAPFFIHEKQNLLTIDLSYSINGRENGSFLASDFGKLDLVLLLTPRTYYKYFSSQCEAYGRKTSKWRWITTNGGISRRIANDGKWYTTYGGIMDISLKHLDHLTRRLLKRNRLALVEVDTDGEKTIKLSEFPRGIVFGPKGNSIVRLNPGESHTSNLFVSSYGRPVKGASVTTKVIKGVVANAECGRNSCNTTMGYPLDALRISSKRSSSKTDRSGALAVTLTAVKDPGNVRGCGLDGQVYPLSFVLRYAINGRAITFWEGGLIPTDGSTYTDNTYSSTVLSSAVRIFNTASNIECPTWNDVKHIFIQYYNLYPVMWKNAIIDLHSYEDIRKKWRLLKASMFETAISSPRYMPISRDLSGDKKMLIWNWMKCGMKRYTAKTNSRKDGLQHCEKDNVARGIKDIRRLLEKAVMLELSTVPPYVTAWLSLKSEYGRNKEIADITKSIFNEEMVHMTLAANILNAVGGTVNMTDMSKLPAYPTVLSSGDFYELCPDMQVSLGPFSIGRVKDVFSEIERPASHEHKKVMYEIAALWKMLPSAEEEADFVSQRDDDEIGAKMLHLIREYEAFEGNKPLADIRKTTAAMGRFKSPSEMLQRANILKQIWLTIGEHASRKIQNLMDTGDKNIGSFYAMVALRLTKLESCARVELLDGFTATGNDSLAKSSGTIFVGNHTQQLNMSQWYKGREEDVEEVMREMGDFPSRISHTKQGASNMHYPYKVISSSSTRTTRPLLFEVTNLKTALEAIVEIVYQGEGGSECTPFVSEHQLFASSEGKDAGRELSHYYRFQEIVHGRKLIKVKAPPSWGEWVCLNATHQNCPSLAASGEAYCYAGEQITFYKDGVWPVLENPPDGAYEKGTLANRLDHQFNLLYTRLLFCLEDAFGGNPSLMQQCMSIMYDMTIVGKQLVSTPLGVVRDSSRADLGKTGTNGCPTWLFVREKPYRAGLPIRT